MNITNEMVKTLDYRQFEKLVKKNGYEIKLVTKHSSKIIDTDGNLIMAFAIDHKAGHKDQIKIAYVKRFEKLIQNKE